MSVAGQTAWGRFCTDKSKLQESRNLRGWPTPLEYWITQKDAPRPTRPRLNIVR